MLDSRTGDVRYVGKTVQSLERRLTQHCDRESRTHKGNWVASVLAGGGQVEIRLLEVVPSWRNWEEAEARWIRHYRDAGVKLTNATDGGDGSHNLAQDVRDRIANTLRGRKASPELRAKLQEIARNSPLRLERVEKMRAANLGRSRGPEFKEKLRQINLGKTLSEETKKRLSASHMGKKLSKEHCLSLSRAGMGRVQSEETKRKRAAYHIGAKRSEVACQRISDAQKANAAKDGYWNRGGEPNAMSVTALAEAYRLRSLGIGYEKIGVIVGASAMTVHRALNGKSPSYAA